MEILNELPEDLYFNVIKYLKHPVAEMIENFIITEPRTRCLEYLRIRLDMYEYDVVHCCKLCLREMNRNLEMEYEYKFYPIYFCNYCEESDFDED